MNGRSLRTAILATTVTLAAPVVFAQTDANPVQHDKMFVHKASEGNMAEIQLAQLALQKSGNDQVKQFAQKMIDDHTTLMNNMKQVADQMGVQPPTKLNKMDQATYDKLSALSGPDFDKAYIADMVKDHHKDLREFIAEEKSTTDPTLKQTVTSGEKVIREHTQLADQLAQSMSIPVPNGGKLPPEPTM